MTNQPLAKPLRSQLETTVKSARDVVDKAAGAALAQLDVADAQALDYVAGHPQKAALRRRLRDGVRLYIRPFMTAEVLRHNKKPKLNITWDKDRGQDVETAPWFKAFNGHRINDHHLALADMRAARAKASQS